MNRFPKPPPEKVLRAWAREWSRGRREMGLGKPPSRPTFEKLPRRRIAERTLALVSHAHRVAEDRERPCRSTGEASVHATLAHPMTGPLAHG